MIGISPCSRDVFAPLLNKLVYVLDSLMAGHYIHMIFHACRVKYLVLFVTANHM